MLQHVDILHSSWMKIYCWKSCSFTFRLIPHSLYSEPSGHIWVVVQKKSFYFCEFITGKIIALNPCSSMYCPEWDKSDVFWMIFLFLCVQITVAEDPWLRNLYSWNLKQNEIWLPLVQLLGQQHIKAPKIKYTSASGKRNRNGVWHP